MGKDALGPTATVRVRNGGRSDAGENRGLCKSGVRVQGTAR